MARRRKQRAAPKSNATEDPALTRHHYKESSILKPVSPSTHSDDWPCFLLSDATVHRPDGSLANQLHVDVEGPFIVRGKLELEKDNERYLTNRNIKTSDLRIQIDSSNAFSVGYKDESLSVPVVWASGAAGWFEIVPSQTYQRICDEMFQGVCLHYSFLEQYENALEQLQESRKKAKKKKATMADVQLDIDELLFQYALRSGDGLTLPDARRRLLEQSFFLLSHFPKDTDLYKGLAKEHSGVIRHMEKRRAGEAKPRLYAPSTSLIAYDYPHREKSSSLDVDGKKKGRGRPKNSVPRSTRTGEVSEVEAADRSTKLRETQLSRSARAKKRSSADIPVKDDDIVMTDPPSNITLSSRPPRESRGAHAGDSAASNSNATEGTKSSGQVLVDALEDVRRQMLKHIAEGKQKKQLHQISDGSWRFKAYLECQIKRYETLQEVFHYHAQYLAQHLGPEWHDTTIYRWAQENASKPLTLNLITETEIKQIVRRVKKTTRGSHVEKTVNETSQPEAREYAGKQTPRNRPSGKAAGLRPSTGSKKRLRHEIDFEDSMDIDEDGLLKKKSKRLHSLMGDEDEDEDEDEDDDTAEDGIDLSRESDPSAKNDGIPMTQLVIRAEKLPSTQPQGPNQTWVCDEPDCGYVVRAADEERGQKLISTHYDEHEKEAQDVAQEMAFNRVNLAVQEGTRGRMPINHLLEKIRKIGEKSNRRDEVHLNGHVIPERIKRTLLI
ncbi:hypothetical protein F5B17DRAFT_387675 [Nemania serpens]|nr:hypothetical protein F5B17DRAFT_387675 [Nemania serpens]